MENEDDFPQTDKLIICKRRLILMLLDVSDKKQRITNLTLKYDICTPFKKIAQILWINRLKELSYVKNKKSKALQV